MTTHFFAQKTADRNLLYLYLNSVFCDFLRLLFQPQFPEKIFQHLCTFRLEQSGVYFWCPVIGQCEQLFH